MYIKRTSKEKVLLLSSTAMASRSKSFECTVCSRRFTTAKGRDDHQKAVHGGLVMASQSKPFECTVCWKRFTTAYGRDDHQRTVHYKRQMKRGNHFVPVSKFR